MKAVRSVNLLTSSASWWEASLAPGNLDFSLGSYFNFLLTSPRSLLHSDFIFFQFLTGDSLNHEPVYPFLCLPCSRLAENMGDMAAKEYLFSRRLYLIMKGWAAWNKSLICHLSTRSAKCQEEDWNRVGGSSTRGLLVVVVMMHVSVAMMGMPGAWWRWWRAWRWGW